MSRVHELAQLSVIGLRSLLLEYKGFGRGGIEALLPVFSGAWIDYPGGRVPVIPWDRDRLITKILEAEEA